MATLSPKDRKLALAVAIDALKAERDQSDRTRWLYFAEEVDSWYSVSEESLLAYVVKRDAHPATTAGRQAAYDEWAESDDDAVDYGRRPPRGRP